MSDDMAGKSVTCAKCGITFAAVAHDPVSPRGSGLRSVILGAVCVLLLLYSAVMTVRAVSLKNSLAAAKDDLARMETSTKNQIEEAGRDAEAECQKRIEDAKQQVFQEAKIQAATEVKSMAQEAQDVLNAAKARDEGRLHEIFPALRPYVSGINTVPDGYLKSFEIGPEFKAALGSGMLHTVKIVLGNNTNGLVKPNVDLYLMNRYGFVTGKIGIAWLINRMNPGDTRNEEHPVGFEFGDPAYYMVVYK